MIMDKILISVVTVCLNAEKDIECTINSILEQDLAGFEYLIKDGGSGDMTVRIAEGYMDRFNAKGISFRVISGKDDGLYDAMNKATAASSGEWIMFINAGDALFDESVLSRISSEITDDADVIYGNAVLADDGHYKLLRAGNTGLFKNCNPICHQASITRRDVVGKLGFDTGYEIAADFDLFLRIFLSGEKRFKKTGDALCIYPLNGVSSNSVLKREREFDISRRRNGLKRVCLPKMQILKIVCTDIIRKLAVKLLGAGFYSGKRGWYPDKNEAVRAGECDV